jgi:hypothetical protein
MVLVIYNRFVTVLVGFGGNLRFSDGWGSVIFLLRTGRNNLAFCVRALSRRIYQAGYISE